MKKIAKFTKKYLKLSMFTLVLGFIGVTITAPAIVHGQAVPADPTVTCGSACCNEETKKTKSPCIPQDQVDQLNKNTQAATDSKAIKCPSGKDCGGIISQIINPLINLMTALVGVIVAISIVAAGIMYSSAGGDPGKVAAAKKRITGSILALIAYLFTFGMLQWLVPGGLL